MSKRHCKGEVVIVTGSKSWELVLITSQIMKNIIITLEGGLSQSEALELIAIEVDLLF